MIMSVAVFSMGGREPVSLGTRCWSWLKGGVRHPVGSSLRSVAQSLRGVSGRHWSCGLRCMEVDGRWGDGRREL